MDAFSERRTGAAKQRIHRAESIQSETKFRLNEKEIYSDIDKEAVQEPKSRLGMRSRLFEGISCSYIHLVCEAWVSKA